jgi:hypothetical protein
LMQRRDCVRWVVRKNPVERPCAHTGPLTHPSSADTRKPDQVLVTRLPGWRLGLRQRWHFALDPSFIGVVGQRGRSVPMLPAPGLGRERRPGEPGYSVSPVQRDSWPAPPLIQLHMMAAAPFSLSARLGRIEVLKYGSFIACEDAILCAGPLHNLGLVHQPASLRCKRCIAESKVAICHNLQSVLCWHQSQGAQGLAPCLS